MAEADRQVIVRVGADVDASVRAAAERVRKEIGEASRPPAADPAVDASWQRVLDKAEAIRKAKEAGGAAPGAGVPGVSGTAAAAGIPPALSQVVPWLLRAQPLFAAATNALALLQRQYIETNHATEMMSRSTDALQRRTASLSFENVTRGAAEAAAEITKLNNEIEGRNVYADLAAQGKTLWKDFLTGGRWSEEQTRRDIALRGAVVKGLEAQVVQAERLEEIQQKRAAGLDLEAARLKINLEYQEQMAKLQDDMRQKGLDMEGGKVVSLGGVDSASNIALFQRKLNTATAERDRMLGEADRNEAIRLDKLGLTPEKEKAFLERRSREIREEGQSEAERMAAEGPEGAFLGGRQKQWEKEDEINREIRDRIDLARTEVELGEEAADIKRVQLEYEERIRDAKTAGLGEETIRLMGEERDVAIRRIRAQSEAAGGAAQHAAHAPGSRAMMESAAEVGRKGGKAYTDITGHRTAKTGTLIDPFQGGAKEGEFKDLPGTKSTMDATIDNVGARHPFDTWKGDQERRDHREQVQKENREAIKQRAEEKGIKRPDARKELMEEGKLRHEDPVHPDDAAVGKQGQTSAAWTPESVSNLMELVNRIEAKLPTGFGP